jgi:hypothetical protein
LEQITKNKSPYDVLSWKKDVDAREYREKGKDRERDPLGAVNTNTNGQAPSELLHRAKHGQSAPNNSHFLPRASASTSRPNRLSISGSIPRPAATPDVFAPDPLKPRSSLLTQSTVAATGKRARENVNPCLPLGSSRTPGMEHGHEQGSRQHAKRAKVEEVKMEEERWRAKWIKVFPTLIFHFEIGAEEVGKGLKGRVIKMGAVRLLCSTFCGSPI